MQEYKTNMPATFPVLAIFSLALGVILVAVAVIRMPGRARAT